MISPNVTAQLASGQQLEEACTAAFWQSICPKLTVSETAPENARYIGCDGKVRCCEICLPGSA